MYYDTGGSERSKGRDVLIAKKLNKCTLTILVSDLFWTDSILPGILITKLLKLAVVVK